MKQLLVFLVLGLSMPWSLALKEDAQMMTIQDEAIQDIYHDPVYLQVHVPLSIDVSNLRIIRKADKTSDEDIICTWEKTKMYYKSDIPVKDGDHIQYYLFDMKNNKQIYASNKFTVDSVKPQLHIIYNGYDQETVQLAYPIAEEMQIYFTDLHLDKTKTSIHMYEDGKEIKSKNQKDKITFMIQKGKQYRLDAKGVDAAGNETEYKTSSTFYVDEQKPTGTLFFQNQPMKQKEYLLFEPEMFTLDAIDDHFNQEKSSMLINGEVIHKTWNVKNNVWTQEWQCFEDGTYEIGYHIEDMAGNVSEASGIHVVQDKKAPIVQYKMNGKTVEVLPQICQEIQLLEWMILDQTLDLKRSYIQVDQKNIQIMKEKDGLYHATTSLQAGTHHIQMMCVDRAGRVTQKEQTIIVDNQPPVVTLSSIPRYTNKITSIHLTLKDEVVQPNDIRVSLLNDCGEVISTVVWNEFDDHTFEADIVVQEQGNYIVQVEGYDKAGNQIMTVMEGGAESLLDNKYSFTIDKEAPIVSYHLDQTAPNINHDQLVSITIDDQNICLRDFQLICKKDGHNIQKDPEIMDDKHLFYRFQEEGAYEFLFSMQDLAGNKAIYKCDFVEQPKPIQFVIDKTRPVIQITGLENNKVTNYIRKASIGVTDKQLKTCSVFIQRNQEQYTKECSSEPLVFDEVSGAFGEYRVYVQGQDYAGNETISQTYHFAIDRKPPTIKFLLNEMQIPNDETYLTNQNVQMHMEWIDQNLSSYRLMVDKDGVQKDVITDRPSADYTIEAHKGEKHVYTLHLEGEDLAQNNVQFTTTIIVDTRAPLPSIDTGMLSDANGKQYFTPKLLNDGRNYQVISYTLTQNHNVIDYVWGDEIKEDGNYILDVMVVDEAMNIAHLQEPLYFEIDNIPPNILLKQGDTVLDDHDEISNETIFIMIQQDEEEKALKERFTALTINGEQITDFKRDEQGNMYDTIQPDHDLTISASAIDGAGNTILKTWDFKYQSKNALTGKQCIFYISVIIVGLCLIYCYGKQHKNTRAISL